jgi:hypothetical protein
MKHAQDPIAIVRKRGDSIAGIVCLSDKKQVSAGRI